MTSSGMLYLGGNAGYIQELGDIPMSHLPETGFLRLPQIIGDPKAQPPIPPLIPVKKSCWWDGVKSGRFPKPVKFGRCTMWRVEDIRALIASA